MGDRAIISTEAMKMGVYLHWNGSPNQVRGFLAYCEMMGFRPPETDDYGWAQLIKIIGNFIDGNERSDGLSLGIVSGTVTSPGDNGLYIIRNWHIVRRIPAFADNEDEDDEALLAMMERINECQPWQVPYEEMKNYIRKRRWAHDPEPPGFPSGVFSA